MPAAVAASTSATSKPSTIRCAGYTLKARLMKKSVLDIRPEPTARP